ncbi:MAG: hypothetical protein CML56_09050 [Rhodobacteraceae bacterium]|nr:hypothetical protein [Paracoccaceae bacterium]
MNKTDKLWRLIVTTSVLKVHEDRVQALVEGDLNTLDRCVSDDLTFTTPHGTLLTKAMVFDSIRSGRMDVKRMQVDDLVLREYGDTAVITYRALTSYTDGEALVDGIVCSTTIYLFRDNCWQLIAAQQGLVKSS